MVRKKRTPEEMERRAKIRELLQVSNVSSMVDIQNLFKETIAEFMENSLDAELDDELGYSKYDYRSKDTAEMAIVARRCAPASGMWIFPYPVIARANSSRRCSRKTRPASVRISKKRFCPCTPRA